MAANGGGSPFVKKEEECDPNTSNSISTTDNNSNNNNLHLHHGHVEKNEGASNSRRMSIAERRAARCGFNAASINAGRFNTAAAAAAPYFTVPPGLSPSALLDSPVLMLPNAQAQLSPTTGTFHIPSSPNQDTLTLKLKLSWNGEDATPADTETCGSDHREAPNSITENKPRSLQEMRQKECFGHQMSSEKEVMHHHDQYQKSAPIPKEVMTTKNLDDGFNWRKYGQKHVKGSEYPRSYYKCTSTNCPVTKKVERSHDGQITEVVYKGSHNHPQPQPQPQPLKMEEAKDAAAFSSESKPNIVLERCSSFLNEFAHDHPTSRSFQAVEAHELAADDRNEASSESVSLNGEDDENAECEANKRKRSESETAAPPRSTREPKVVIQIESDIDILDDGYRWRKYGQKVVKGNPNPRSYYKCTTPGCPVRKHVERAAENIKFVVTTYEGKHNHQVPSTKNGNGSLSHVANHQLPPSLSNSTAVTPWQKPKQVQELSLYLERSNSKPILNYNELNMDLGAYSLPIPSFHSLPLPYGSVLMNSNSKPTLSSTLYPMMPDYMTMPSPHVNVAASTGGTHHVNHDGSSYHCRTSSHHHHHHHHHHQIQPWSEQMKDEDDQVYDDTCISVPNQGNGTM